MPGMARPRDPDDEDVRAYVSRQWADEWDSPEDAIYDDTGCPLCFSDDYIPVGQIGDLIIYRCEFCGEEWS